MLCVFLVLLPCVLCLVPEILFLVNTQGGDHHQAMARRTEDFLLHQYQQMTDGQTVPDILWSGRDLHHPASQSFLSRYPAVEWVVILNENTDFFLHNFISLIRERG